MKNKYPIGIQDFPKLREFNCLYVDKTTRIHELICGAAGPVFLSRPRRFGKSLLCSTLGAIFEGRRDLFKGLAIDVELKVNGTTEEALSQINDKDYALSYEGQGKKIIKIGIEFDKEKRNIGRWMAV